LNVFSSMSLLNCTTKRLSGATSMSPSRGSANTTTGGFLGFSGGGGGGLTSARADGRGRELDAHGLDVGHPAYRLRLADDFDPLAGVALEAGIELPPAPLVSVP
jgi:hypothetical protein